jgi:hypothetical protein
MLGSRSRWILPVLVLGFVLCGCGKSGHKEQVQELMQKLNMGTDEQRREAAVALGQVGPPAEEALPLLYQALEGKKLTFFGPQDPFVDDVTSAIALIAKGKAVDHAYSLFKMGEGEEEMLLVILKVGDDAVPSLCKLISPSQDPKTCEWALTWLSLIGDKITKNKQIVVRTLKNASAHKDGEVRKRAEELFQKVK